MPRVKRDKNFFEVDVAGFAVFFNRKYHLISIINDLTLGLWFLTGSILFIFSGTQTIGTIFFILGSAQLFGRPVLKLLHGFFARKETTRKRVLEKPSDDYGLK